MGLRDRWHQQNLVKDGVAAEARVLDKSLVEHRAGGLRIQGRDITSDTERLIVEVQPEGEAPFRAELIFTIRSSELGSSYMTPGVGGTVPVRYDPKDHEVVLDTEKMKGRTEDLSQGIKAAQDARADALLGGADPGAAKAAETDALFGQAQAAGFVSPQMQSLMQQAQGFMHQAQAAGIAGAGAAQPAAFPSPGTATVISYETLADTGTVLAVRVRVSCQPPGGAPIETTLDTAVAPHRLGELAAGATLPILFDANDPSKVYPASSLQ